MARLGVADRLDALSRAVELGGDVLPADLVDRARAVESRAGQRLRLSADHTVVALAGATGSGKSSLTNALVGESLAEVDVLRPTTSEALAVVRGSQGSAPLLDWLEVRRRHTLADPETSGRRRTEGGLILLDLPDHDSVRTEHRLEAERLVRLVDLMVWVLDPQKYADAVIHERYLRGLSGHRDVMLVVLNQVDRLSPEERVACHRDLERLLAEDGLAGVRVLDVSARTGDGVDGLREALDAAAARRLAAQARVEADVVALAGEVIGLCTAREASGRRERQTGRAAREELVEALVGAAGVPLVADAVRATAVLHGRRATGWPVTRWLGRFRVDPLRRLHLASGQGGSGGGGRRDGGGAGGRRDSADTRDVTDVVRTSLPAAGPAETARARAAVRGYTDAVTAGAPDPWVLAARRRTEAPEATEHLTGSLDRAVSGTRVARAHRPVWWVVVGVLQWALLVAMVGGLLWLAALAGLDSLLIPAPEPPRWQGVPVPTLAAVGGAVLGLLLAALSRAAVDVGARRQARRATAALRAGVAEVADRQVVEPVAEVLALMGECARSAAQAAGTR